MGHIVPFPLRALIFKCVGKARAACRIPHMQKWIQVLPSRAHMAFVPFALSACVEKQNSRRDIDGRVMRALVEGRQSKGPLRTQGPSSLSHSLHSHRHHLPRSSFSIRSVPKTYIISLCTLPETYVFYTDSVIVGFRYRHQIIICFIYHKRF